MLKPEDLVFSGKKLEDIDLPRIGHQIGVGEDIIHAVIDTETRGKWTDSKGRLPMLYEPHVAYRCAPNKTIRDKLVKAGLAYAKWDKSKKYPADSYPRFWKAYAIDADTAIKACSWGGPQVLGENYTLAGFDTPEQMIRAMLSDEDQQLQAMVNFIKNSGLDDELRVLQAKLDKGQKVTADDARPFVRGYNGSGYERNNYHTTFAKNLNRWVKIPDTPWSPENANEVDPAIYSGKFNKTLEGIQTSLDEIGYYEIGTLDGKWGNRTRGVVLAFRADNGLPETPTIDRDFLAVLATKPQRPISDSRKNATMDDLRKDDAEDVKVADNQSIAGKVTVGVGAAGAAKKALDELQQYSDLADRAQELVAPLYNLVVDNFWLLALGVGGFFIWQTKLWKRIRLEKHRTGKDVSV